MWHGDKEISLRRMRSNRYRKNKKAVLNVKTRTNVSLGHKPYMIAVFLIVPMIIVALGVMAWAGVHKMFSENPMFTVSKVRIDGGKVLSEEMIKEYTRIDEGVNIYSFSMNKIRKDILSRAKNIRNIEITRNLPSEVKIIITERVPLARLGHHGNLVADIDGCVFAVGSGLSELPVLKGYRGGRMVPGKRLEGMALPALTLLETLRYELKDQIDVQLVTVDDSEKIFLRLHDGRSVDLSWEGMHDGGEFSRINLFRKLGKLVRSLRDSRPSHFDSTFDDRIIGRSASLR
jgi:cell division septal protein FtsQ